MDINDHKNKQRQQLDRPEDKNEICGICREIIASNIAWPLCGHKFHQDCLKKWMKVMIKKSIET